MNGYGVKEVKKIVEMIDADAVAIHLNALQEAVQPEGQTNFQGVLEKIGEIAGAIKVPVIVKETGAGISYEDAKALEEAGVKAIDIGGVGGTSFAAVEYYRSDKKKDVVQNFLGEAFWDWGITTAVSLVENAQTVKLPLIASGGVRSGTDIAKALALGASLAAVSQPILEAAVKGTKETQEKLSCLIEELRNVMFLVGAEKLSDLAKSPVVITGKTAEWLASTRIQPRKICKKRSILTWTSKSFLKKQHHKIDKAIEKYIPRKFTKDAVLFKVNPPIYSYNLEPLNKAIADPIWDMLDRGGKRWRPALFLLICEALGKKADYCLRLRNYPRSHPQRHTRNRRHRRLHRNAPRQTLHLQNLPTRHLRKRWKRHVLPAAFTLNGTEDKALG